MVEPVNLHLILGCWKDLAEKNTDDFVIETDLSYYGNHVAVGVHENKISVTICAATFELPLTVAEKLREELNDKLQHLPKKSK